MFALEELRSTRFATVVSVVPVTFLVRARLSC